jgi:2-phosphoglycolate phosphatase
VLYDLDGTLVDSACDIVAAMRHAMLQVDNREPPDADELRALIGRPLSTILCDTGYPSDAASTARFIDSYRDHYARHFRDHTRVFPGVLEVLCHLRQAGVKQAVVTTKHQTQAEMVVEGCGLTGFLDYVHGHKEGRQLKPHPEPMLTALAQLGVQAGAAMVVGDTELDIESGRAAGTATCGVAYGYRPAGLLRLARPDFLIGDIRDLVPVVMGYSSGPCA